ncbi:glycosyltransferase family 2 protein [Epilithonimonas hominis]|uniref:Glycosyltransferase family 2 protein n=1 Tax=Epilithonimonas hominis TaxID=420404 RepID=A0A3N0X804_9FLAO|nr:glycosyltransferase family 2 protein [Epilithonimonas hominis]ROI12941.1 glycosyltransferase family 2 protein [Epilithonimonas hominis]
MNQNSLVSVIIPTFQRSEYLIRAIESVINQTYQNIEIVVVDDNDGDNEYRKSTQENLKCYIEDKKIKYLKHDKNKGLPSARNTGITNSIGEYVAFLDDDDEWLPTKVEKQMELFEKLDDSFGIVGSFWMIVSEFDGKERLRTLKYKGNLSKILALNHFSPPSMVIVKRKYLEQVKYFDENFRWREDIELYYRLSFVCKFDFVNEVLVKYYQHPDALSTNFEKKLIAVVQYLQKHGKTIRKNSLPWSEINEHLAELYAVNGKKNFALKHFFISVINRPFHYSQYIKILYTIFLSATQYKKIRNFK